ncbi:unnamed protein product, partial [Staurois parvus]
RRHSRLRLSITGSRQVIPHQHPAISEDFQQGRDLYVNNTDLSPVSSCTLLCMAPHSRASGNTHTAPIVKQHTAHSYPFDRPSR